MIKEIECRRVINKSKLPEADFVVNPFVGCLHNCAYCYARFMKRFTGHTEPWGTFVDVKKDVGPKTRKEIGKIPSGSTILLKCHKTSCRQFFQIFKNFWINNNCFRLNRHFALVF